MYYFIHAHTYTHILQKNICILNTLYLKIASIQPDSVDPSAAGSTRVNPVDKFFSVVKIQTDNIVETLLREQKKQKCYSSIANVKKNPAVQPTDDRNEAAQLL